MKKKIWIPALVVGFFLLPILLDPEGFQEEMKRRRKAQAKEEAEKTPPDTWDQFSRAVQQVHVVSKRGIAINNRVQAMARNGQLEGEFLLLGLLHHGLKLQEQWRAAADAGDITEIVRLTGTIDANTTKIEKYLDQVEARHR